MRRLLRHILHGLTLLSLLLCVAVVVLWVGSKRVTYELGWARDGAAHSLNVYRGRLAYVRKVWPRGVWPDEALLGGDPPELATVPSWWPADWDETPRKGPARRRAMGFEWSDGITPWGPTVGDTMSGRTCRRCGSLAPPAGPPPR